MNQVIKTFLGLFLMLSLTLISFGLLSSFLMTMQAQNLSCEIVAELENSCFCASVMQECFEKAEEDGYELEICAYTEAGNHYILQKGQTVPEEEEIIFCRTSLSCPFRVPVLSIDETQVITGIAR